MGKSMEKCISRFFPSFRWIALQHKSFYGKQVEIVAVEKKSVEGKFHVDRLSLDF
jgi:hypothetical protein